MQFAFNIIASNATRVTAPAVKTLDHVFRCHFSSRKSKEQIDAYFNRNGDGLWEWPGSVYEEDGRT